jgi:hypothetical protein
VLPVVPGWAPLLVSSPMRPHIAALSLALALVLVAAGTSARAAAPRSKPTGPAVAGTPATHLALPFIQNDYPRALAEARARKVPLFIEAWAPW